MSDTTYRKKMIEVALPLDAINKASAREKSIRHGHPSTLHLWWARRPLAACRAVLFSSLVNDPDDDPMYGGDEDIAATERAKLFDLIEDLVLWENSNNPAVINRARLEIARSIAANKVADGELDDKTPLVANAPELPEETAKYLPDPPPEYTPHDVRFKMPGLKPEQVNHFLAHYAPPVLDPFAGGGSIPLEAQRLGLRAYASDLNPVPVLINKALIEIPPKFAGMPPVNPEWQKKSKEEKAATVWTGARGLAEDVRYYGKWMRDEAEKRIGHLYPKVKVTEEMAADRPDLEPYVGQELTVIAWLWARTVKSPNPAVNGAEVPLIRTFWLSKKKGKECYVLPTVDRQSNTYRFAVRMGQPIDLEATNAGTVVRQGGTCLLSQQPIPFSYIRDEGKSARMSARLMAICVKTPQGRMYVSPLQEHDDIAYAERSHWRPESPISHWPGRTNIVEYGMTQFDHIFTERQLRMLSTFSDLISEARSEVSRHTKAHADDRDATYYADCVATYLAFGVDKIADYNCSLVTWIHQRDQAGHAFTKQALPMVWDYAEVNPLIGAAGDITVSLNGIAKVIGSSPCGIPGNAEQCDVVELNSDAGKSIVITDPPYYDNIAYADLSDFFYLWLRRGVGKIHSDVCSTLATPKMTELIASPYRHEGDAQKAKEHFESGFTVAIDRIKSRLVDGFPLCIFYAFKQAEIDSDDGRVASTGWETFLDGIIKGGLQISGTLPLRTERATRSIGQGTNALASSIVLVCRRRQTSASTVTRRDFANALRKELPEAIKHLQSGNVAPVDLAQASIGPGMAVFSRYKQVVNTDGSPMSVREALQLINQVLDEALAEQESDFDLETRFALRWFEQYGMKEGPFGDAETLAKAMAVAVSGVVDAGIVHSGAGKVRLVARDELDADWDPANDDRLTMWESTQHLIHTLEQDGETGSANLLSRLIEHKGSAYAECVRELSYRLYQTCDRAKRAEEARSYNGLVVSWPEIAKLARELKSSGPKATQHTMFES